MDSDSGFITIIIGMIVVGALASAAWWAFIIFFGVKAFKHIARNLDSQIPTLQQQIRRFSTMSGLQQQTMRPDIIAALSRMNSQLGQLDAIHRQRYELRMGELQGMAANAGIDWTPPPY
jgi:hypothetical protein